MAQYKIENKTLSIEILGTVYDIKKPKFKQIIDMEEKLESLKTKEKLYFMQECLVSYGIPEAVLNELDSEAYLQLLEIVHGTKKN